MTFYSTNKKLNFSEKKWPETDVNGRLKSAIYSTFDDTFIKYKEENNA